MSKLGLCLLVILAASAASPAFAGAVDAGSAAIDEPGALALLALGLVGLVVGRQAARRRD